MNFFTYNAGGFGCVFDSDGVTPIGTGYSVRLYAGLDADEANLNPVGSTTNFGSGATAGYVNAGIVNVSGASGGQTVYLQLRVWEAARGASYETALTNGGKLGKSAVFSAKAGSTAQGSNPGSPPPDANGFSSFAISEQSPVITAQPQSQTVVMGQTATLNVTATSTNTINYQWRFNSVSITGATNVQLVIANIQPSQAGDYSVIVGNANGAVTSTVATVTVLIPSGILTPPASQSVIRGGNATFTVTATGTPPLAYQWRFNGNNLGGAIGATLSLNNVQASQGGNYDVIVSNAAGSITSAPPAFLTVITPPQIGTQPMSQSFSPGGTNTLIVSASGIGLNYQWQFNGTNIFGATGATLTLTNLSVANAGAYRVVITNLAGSVTSDAADLSFFGDLKFLATTVLAGSVGRTYRVEYADVLGGVTNWLTLSNLTLPYSPYLMVDPQSPVKPQRYYRSVLLP